MSPNSSVSEVFSSQHDLPLLDTSSACLLLLPLIYAGPQLLLFQPRLSYQRQVTPTYFRYASTSIRLQCPIALLLLCHRSNKKGLYTIQPQNVVPSVTLARGGGSSFLGSITGFSEQSTRAVAPKLCRLQPAKLRVTSIDPYTSLPPEFVSHPSPSGQHPIPPAGGPSPLRQVPGIWPPPATAVGVMAL